MNATVMNMLVVLSVVCSGLSIAISLNIWRKFLRLTGKDGTKNLHELLSELLTQLEDSKKNHEYIQDLLTRHEKEGQHHLRHVGIVRFNPFPDVGSDQSFTLALLDGHKNGFVISSLHARDKTRMFAKPVVNGKEERYQFSNEERLAVSRALHT